LVEIQALPQDWDSYGAMPVTPAAVAAIRELLQAMQSEPSISPTTDGGVECEWELPGGAVVAVMADRDGALHIWAHPCDY
jgi:hypothetical protein